MSLFATPSIGLGLALASCLAYGGGAAAASRWARAASFVMGMGWALHGLLLTLEVTGLLRADGQARMGFGSVLSITVWLVLAVHALESRLLPVPVVRKAMAWAGVLAVVLVCAFPGEWKLSSASPLAPLHWVLGVASYGLLAAAVLHARWLDRADARLRITSANASASAGQHMPLLRLERLTFAFVAAGFVALTAALALGLLSSGALRIDHKTVFSLLGWAVVAALLLGRRLRGWRGRRATRWLYVGAVLLLLAYAGSRFVFEVVLGRVSP
jgi:ABC-type uncharacterized transport system permease subunit